MAESNRRHHPRKNEEATIQILIAPDESKKSDCIPVKMFNQSENGLYLEIDRALEPGSNISIKMVAPEGDHPEDAYYMHDGRVVWCQSVNDEASRFGVGVQILRKVVRAEVLTSRLVRPA